MKTRIPFESVFVELKDLVAWCRKEYSLMIASTILISFFTAAYGLMIYTISNSTVDYRHISMNTPFWFCFICMYATASVTASFLTIMIYREWRWWTLHYRYPRDSAIAIIFGTEFVA